VRDGCGIDSLDPLGKLVKHGAVECIQALRAIEGDERDMRCHDLETDVSG
jgi:hypothetical protein